MSQKTFNKPIAMTKAPKHIEFSKLDELLRFYFDFYKSHILQINVIKKDFYDREMSGTPQPIIS